MILLDTDHCVFLLRGRREVRAAFEAHGAEEPGISIITIGELYFEALRSARPESNREICQAFIDRVTIVPLDQHVMLRFADGELMGKVKSQFPPSPGTGTHARVTREPES